MLAVAFAAVALLLVHLRAEQTRAAARALAVESEWVELRRELWRLQTGVARLKAPGRIRDRVEWFDAALVPPGCDVEKGRAERIVDSHPHE
jgi:hypothetical protein